MQVQELQELVTEEEVAVVEQQGQQMLERLEGWGLGAVMLEGRMLLLPSSQSRG